MDINECDDPAFKRDFCNEASHYCINKPGYWECIQRGLVVAKAGVVYSAGKITVNLIIWHGLFYACVILHNAENIKDMFRFMHV